MTQQERSLPSADAVASYLEKNPEFFRERPWLLESIAIPHAPNGTISLIDYQITVLKEKNQQLLKKLKNLIQVAGDNELLMQKVHELSLQLLDAPSTDKIIEILETNLKHNFDADIIKLVLFDSSGIKHESKILSIIEQHDPSLRRFSEFLKRAHPLCGRLQSKKLEFFFSDEAPSIKSTALIPVGGGDIGMLAVGSFNPDRYHPAMGTFFLDWLGQMLARALTQHADRVVQRRRA